MTDPIADLLSRLRNAQLAGHREVMVPYSKLKYHLVQLLEREGWISGLAVMEPERQLKVLLKYDAGKPVMRHLNRVSTPGRRVYANRHKLPRVMQGLGTAIISTSQGLMTSQQARKAKLGGEVVCEVS
jgi:small subunit ribosomal protein S8